jgi:hypothetical protein
VARLVNVDYNPLRRAEDSLAGARRAGSLARDIKMVQRSADLSRRYLDLGEKALDNRAFFQNAQLGLNTASTIYSIGEERNRLQIQQQSALAQQELRAEYQDSILNNRIRWETSVVDGKVTGRWTGDFSRIEGIAEKYKTILQGNLWWGKDQGNTAIDAVRAGVDDWARMFTYAKAQQDIAASKKALDVMSLQNAAADPQNAAGMSDFGNIDFQIAQDLNVAPESLDSSGSALVMRRERYALAQMEIESGLSKKLFQDPGLTEKAYFEAVDAIDYSGLARSGVYAAGEIEEIREAVTAQARQRWNTEVVSRRTANYENRMEQASRDMADLYRYIDGDRSVKFTDGAGNPTDAPGMIRARMDTLNNDPRFGGVWMDPKQREEIRRMYERLGKDKNEKLSRAEIENLIENYRHFLQSETAAGNMTGPVMQDTYTQMLKGLSRQAGYPATDEGFLRFSIDYSKSIGFNETYADLVAQLEKTNPDLHGILLQSVKSQFDAALAAAKNDPAQKALLEAYDREIRSWLNDTIRDQGINAYSPDEWKKMVAEQSSKMIDMKMDFLERDREGRYRFVNSKDAAGEEAFANITGYLELNPHDVWVDEFGNTHALFGEDVLEAYQNGGRRRLAYLFGVPEESIDAALEPDGNDFGAASRFTINGGEHAGTYQFVRDGKKTKVVKLGEIRDEAGRLAGVRREDTGRTNVRDTMRQQKAGLDSESRKLDERDRLENARKMLEGTEETGGDLVRTGKTIGKGLDRAVGAVAGFAGGVAGRARDAGTEMLREGLSLSGDPLQSLGAGEAERALRGLPEEEQRKIVRRWIEQGIALPRSVRERFE